MRPEDRESLLWALSEIAVSRDHTAVPSDSTLDDSTLDDSTLRAYREGRLSEDDSRRLERRLVADPASRRRLEKLAGQVPASAPPGIRRRVLESIGGPRARPRQVRRRLRWRLGLAAAAVLVIAVGWLTLRSRQVLPPAYEVRIAALTERRDQGVAATVAEAYADSTVEITATVAERAVLGVEVGIYRVAGRRLERVGDSDRVRRRKRPGAVLIEAPAAELVGEEPGEHEIFVVIAWRGRLPAAVAFQPGADPAAVLAAGGRRQVHRLTLRLLAERSAELLDSISPDEEVACFAHAFFFTPTFFELPC